PLSVQWVWPSPLPYGERYEALTDFSRRIAADFGASRLVGHPLEIGLTYLHERLAGLRRAEESDVASLPYLAALVAFSPFDLALHDAYGKLHGVPTYSTYNPPYLT